ncbi:MAG: penicillin-binding protein 2 [Desulfobulbaceae bacterium]|nr:penicillin-binding protein 2 [Desulfobulbaceae bacterium]
MRRFIQLIYKSDEAELVTLKKRVDIATAVILFLVAVLVARLWYLQIHKGAEYQHLSENNRIRVQKIAAPRGDILDRNGKIIVTNRPCFNIVWIKEDAPDPDVVIKRLAAILNIDISELLDRIRESAGQPRYVPMRLREDIDWQTLVYIENHRLDLPGVRIEAVPIRDYLYGNFASHIIGYPGHISKKELEASKSNEYRGGDQIGKMGLEKIFEKNLRGEQGKRYVEVDVHGFEQKQLQNQEPLPGNDLQLTLDLDLQLAAERALAGKAGAIVTMDVNSGRILTLASSPPMKLKQFLGGISVKHWKEHLDDPLHPLLNKAIQGQYPPGSTYKIVTALAGLSEKAISPQTISYCTGSMTLYRRRYGCWKRRGHGAIDLNRALSESCDVYFYQVGQKVGVNKLAQYAGSLGLGKKSGIILEHEKSGLTPTKLWKKKNRNESWQEGETMSVSIGQGFNLATPLQICNMTATLANGGTRYRPMLIKAILDPEGKIIEQFEPIIDGKALGTKKSLDLIKKGLVAAVNSKHGTGGRAKLEGITVAGKTGTSQVVRLAQYRSVPEDKVPYKYRDHAWFTCFAPADNPEIAIAVLMEHSGHGGSQAAPLAKQVLEQYFNIKPDAPEGDS